MFDVILITSIDGYLVKRVINTSNQKQSLKDFCLQHCKNTYDIVPRRTRYGFFLYNSEFDITVYYILRHRIKGKTIL